MFLYFVIIFDFYFFARDRMQTETSEVMTLWGYTNLFIIIIIIFFSPPAQSL